jgi:hypothetical protein
MTYHLIILNQYKIKNKNNTGKNPEESNFGMFKRMF